MKGNLRARRDACAPAAVAVFRVVFGALFACHGLSKLVGWPATHAVPVGQWPLYYAGWIELVTGALVVIGLFTRIAAGIACGEMAVAYFIRHLPLGLVPITNKGELALLYCFAFLLLVFLGAGAYGLDARRSATTRQLTRSPRGREQ
ncbi:DoxX family protein [Mycobacterium sp. SM1]|uniref:DoxX family protein n=1 Tax=Mycobacterium sp. SM1 TaxID=2816243 RepID=UPI001BCAA84F|nr:DoxX family protein [Mycobacterium sp. SM1]MBS4730223.1 DoxX family protein [Mycobacterium sp. SM1]